MYEVYESGYEDGTRDSVELSVPQLIRGVAITAFGTAILLYRSNLRLLKLLGAAATFFGTRQFTGSWKENRVRVGLEGNEEIEFQRNLFGGRAGILTPTVTTLAYLICGAL